ncbi:MAG: hypothetical protein [Bacteriophage sp.]|nr:MAG: hypothetical protein [Bacteriophage sp.]
MKLIHKKEKFPFANYTFIELFFCKLVVLNFFFIYIPFFVFFTDKNRYIPKESIACVRFLCIFIRPRFSTDYSILTHEVVHLKQSLSTFYLHLVLYNFNHNYRYESEIEAYTYQCLHLIIHTEVGENSLIIEEAINWISEVLGNDKFFIIKLNKNKKTIKNEVTKNLIKKLKIHQKFLDKT